MTKPDLVFSCFTVNLICTDMRLLMNVSLIYVNMFYCRNNVLIKGPAKHVMNM